MLSLNMTAGNDNDVIWVFRINLDSSIIYLATTAITLDANDYLETIIKKNTPQSTSKSVNILQGGGVSTRENLTIAFDKFSTINQEGFYPYTSMPYLSSRLVEVGFVWNTATTEAEITWYNTFYVDGYSYAFNQITLELIEFSEIESTTLPFYKVQKDYDDGISYTLTAESYGDPIPLLYGDFTETSFEISTTRLAPTVSMNKDTSAFKVCSHPCYQVCYGNYKHDATDRTYAFVPMDNYTLVTYSANTAYYNSDRGHLIILLNTTDVVYGYMKAQFIGDGSKSTVTTTNAIDNSATTYTQIAGGGSEIIALRLGQLSSSQIGILSATADDVRQVWMVAADDAGSRAFTTYFFNQNGVQALIGGAEQTSDGHASSITGATLTEVALDGFADETTATSLYPSLPHSIDDLSSYEYIIRNDDVDAGDELRVAYGYLELSNILVSGTIPAKYTGFTAGIYNARGG
ncbi:MAG: hypothetical protein IPJ03_15720 [Ignavibacteriales bacterium]|nr:hypothetical protein [Ignavibacteriales bacterium]